MILCFDRKFHLLSGPVSWFVGFYFYVDLGFFVGYLYFRVADLKLRRVGHPGCPFNKYRSQESIGGKAGADFHGEVVGVFSCFYDFIFHDRPALGSKQGFCRCGSIRRCHKNRGRIADVIAVFVGNDGNAVMVFTGERTAEAGYPQISTAAESAATRIDRFGNCLISTAFCGCE